MGRYTMRLGISRLLAIALMVPVAVLEAATYTVGLDGWQDFTTIYDAYTNSSAKGEAGVGDIIEVYNGTYTNYVWIGSPGRTIRAATGQTPVWATSGGGVHC
ncbi:MAG: hypothetical protein PHR35_14635 [Kiritimatiellae bacterium]|nr:hypothetical protein [Kiritimatiellia bacterium]